MTTLPRRVLLLSPPNSFMEHRSVPRMGLLSLGTMLRHEGHEVIIRHLRDLHELESLADSSWDLIGISATTREYSDAVQMLNYVKRQGERARVLLGGPHATAMPEEALRNGFDVVVTGEADYEILEVARVLPTQQIRLDCPPVPSLDELSFVDRSLLDDPASWRPSLYHGQPPGMRIAPMIVSRGCPYACKFCGPHEHYRRRSDDNIGEELELLKRDGYQGLILLDDLPFLDERDVRGFCERIEPLGMAFRTNFRTDLFGERIAERLIDAGCRRVQFGVESASSVVLDGVGKGTVVDRGGEAVAICRKLHLEVKAMFVWGLPGDDESTAQELVEWVERYRPDAIQVSVFGPLPGSPLWAGHGARVTDYNRLAFFRSPTSRDTIGVGNDRLSPERLVDLYDWILAECASLTRIDRGSPLEATPQET
jgi:radical SAM superfamily enzyme YgiQ (UPF0313 family)